MILHYSSKNIVAKLDSVLRALDLPIVKQRNYISHILPAIDSLRYFYSAIPQSANFHSNCGNYLDEIKRQASEKLPKDDFWIMTIENLIQENIEFKTADYWQKRDVRDFQMAQNMQWLTKVKYPNEKIIVWAANYHVAKYSDISKNYPYKKLISMGSYFTQDSSLLRQTYIIGFTSYEGEAGRIGMQNYKVRKPKPGGFENWIDQSYNYAFVDFKGLAKRSETFYLKGLSHSSAFKRDWANVFDGVFYIKKMYPCEK
jgi:erythromycin esterase